MSDSIGNKIYSGSAELGKIQSSIGLYVAMFVSIIMICIAVYLFTRKSDGLVDGKAIVQNSQCTSHYDTHAKRMMHNCDLTVKYVVDGKEYTGKTGLTSNTAYNIGDSVDISYDPKNPTQIRPKEVSKKLIAVILSVVALLVGGGAFLNYYLTSKSETYAAAQGAATTMNVLASPFRSL